MQAVVGGYIEEHPFSDGAILICNEEGELRKLPLNRVLVARAPEVDGSYDFIFAPDGAAAPGEMGFYNFRGDVFLCRYNTRGDTLSVTDADIAKYSAIMDAAMVFPAVRP